MLEELKINLRIALRTWSGKIGFALLLIQIILALYAVAVYYPEGMYRYGRGSDFFYYYPVSVPPCWAVDKPSIKYNISLDDMSKRMSDKLPDTIKSIDKQTYSIYEYYKQFGFKVIVKEYETNITVNKPGLPSDISMILAFHLPSEYMPDKVVIYTAWMYIERPDGIPVFIMYKSQLYEPNLTQVIVYGNIVKETENGVNKTVLRPLTLANYNNSKYVATTFSKSLKMLQEALNISNKELRQYVPEIILAGRSGNEILALNGEYKINLGVAALVAPTVSEQEVSDIDSKSGVDAFQLVIKPNCYGLMGTDTKARPISLGLLLGLPYAFMLGFTVTFVSTFIGAIYGTLAGYWKDYRGEALMRIVDVVLSLPFLPILIAISAAFGTIDLKWLAIIMIALSWAGPVIVVRSMALQISEQLYVEAAKAVGVNTRKIIFKHIFPQIYPYTMAIAVLSIPGIIVAEASLALLGFGDPQAPTWGKMLQLAYNAHSVSNGWWWMYIFPGLALVVFSATFLLVGRAIEPIVAPKLQR